jgi:hypothetical protein
MRFIVQRGMGWLLLLLALVLMLDAGVSRAR